MKKILPIGLIGYFLLAIFALTENETPVFWHSLTIAAVFYVGTALAVKD